MTAKHIPGPWKIIDRKVLEDGSVYPRHIVGGYFDMEVCQMEGAASAHEFVNNPDWKEFGESQMGMANARLIAAAPDLLSALEAVKSWDVSNLALDIPLEIRKQMQAAIAKATGEQK